MEIIKSDGRPNPFKKCIPGDKWFKGFLNRHPKLSLRHADSISAARASVTEEAIKNWHEIKIHLKEEKCVDILEDPTRIFNSNESGFETNPKTGLVLGPRGMKNFYQVKSGSEKEQITVLFY
ncbi:hypothetical protein NQ314_016228 [Rhamnusium bicolor]|uniref:Transposase n=1 Tax=Rhamnusium bicolor TaxID=1586634 RepID=A0AAV8WWE9_9CUCU|nr:hypothetical protein NQ314_016228 [Rhamnusium bicolor]